MTVKQDQWAEAQAIERLQGWHAPGWLPERIGGLALAGDEAGVPRFREIAARYGQLLCRQPS